MGGMPQTFYARLQVNYQDVNLPRPGESVKLCHWLFTGKGSGPLELERVRVHLTMTARSGLDKRGFFLAELVYDENQNSRKLDELNLNLAEITERTIEFTGNMIPRYAYEIAKEEGHASPLFMRFCGPSKGDDARKIYMPKSAYYDVAGLFDETLFLCDLEREGYSSKRRDPSQPIIEERDQLRRRLNQIKEGFEAITGPVVK